MRKSSTFLNYFEISSNMDFSTLVPPQHGHIFHSPIESSNVIAAKNGFPSPIDSPRSSKPLSQNFFDLTAFGVDHFFIIFSL